MALAPFSLVRVPFPFTDRKTSKRRPALVLSCRQFQQDTGHLLLAMVTSARQSHWPLDWAIQEIEGTGLPQPCLVRFKLFTLDEQLMFGALGALATVDRQAVSERLQQLLPA